MTFCLVDLDRIQELSLREVMSKSRISRMAQLSQAKQKKALG